MISQEHYHYLRRLDDFRFFPIDEFDRLVASMTFKKVQKDQVIFYEGDKRDRLYLLSSGYIKLEQVDQSGHFMYTDFVNKDTVFPYGHLFQTGNYQYSAIAITDVAYFTISVDLYESYSLNTKKQMKWLYAKMSNLLALHEVRLRNMITSSAKTRVIQSLAILLFELCHEGTVLPFPVTTIDIASLSGTRRETVSRVLKELKESDKITFKNQQLIYHDRDYFLQYII